MSRHDSEVSRRTFLRVGVNAVAGTQMCLLSGCSSRVAEEGPLSFGVVTDVQYADADPVKSRIYRGSPEKLKAAVAHLNTMNLDFVINLGDLIDRDYFSFYTVLPIVEAIKAPVAHVLGNHDFKVAENKKHQVPECLGMTTRYYDFVMGRWRFVVLDGNDVSLHAHVKGSEAHREAAAMLEALKGQNRQNAKPWNGAVGDGQLQWLSGRLKKATQARQKVIVFCHWPVYPEELDTLWNAEELMAVLESSDSVAAYFGGHHHDGGYGVKDGIHYVTFRAMLDGADRTSYGTVRLTSNAIEITGYGDEPSRTLT